MKKVLFISISLSIFITTAVIANFQLREALPAQTSSVIWPYNDQFTFVDDWSLEIMYTWDGEVWEGNFFRWDYFDPAHGAFTLWTTPVDRITITSNTWWSCPSWYYSRNLTWSATSDYVGRVSFDHNSIPWWRDSVYICIPDDVTDSNTPHAFLSWFTYSPHIWYQWFEWIQVASTVEGGVNDADSRRLRVIGIATSSNPEDALGDQFVSDVRVFWNVSKVELRALMQRNVQNAVRNINPSWSANLSISSAQLSSQSWNNNISGTNRVLNDRVLYVWRESGEIVNLQWWNLSTNSNKTLVVEWANVYISSDIRWDGILWIISLEKNGQWGNIYIDPSVTDIHAFLYADRSVISYDWWELDGSTPDNQLANQLYIKWVLFSENTIWGSVLNPAECPFYVTSSDCDTVEQAMKYDLNFLRRYQIAPDRDANGDIIPDSFSPSHGAAESYMWGDTPNDESQRSELREFPVILEYDNRIVNDAPPLFSR